MGVGLGSETALNFSRWEIASPLRCTNSINIHYNAPTYQWTNSPGVFNPSMVVGSCMNRLDRRQAG